MKRNILVFGTIAGVIISTFMATAMAIMSCSSDEGGSAGSMVMGYTAMAVAFSFVFVGIKNYRDKQNGGVITFGKGFWLGFMISLIASTLYVITWAVEFHLFLPDFIDKYGTMQLKQLLDRGVKGDELVKNLTDMSVTAYNYKHNPFFFAMYTYLEILPVGILITLISAAVLRRKTAATN